MIAKFGYHTQVSILEKPGAVIPQKRSNPCGTPGYFDELGTGLCGGRAGKTPYRDGYFANKS